MRLEDGATSASYVPLGEPSLMDDHGACKRTLATRARRSRRICWHRLICAVPCAWGTLYSSCIKGTSEQEQATSGGAGYDAGIIIGRPDLQNDEHPVLAVALAPGSDAATSNKSAPSIKEGEADTGTQGLSVEVKERNEEQLRPLRMRKLVKYENWNGS